MSYWTTKEVAKYLRLNEKKIYAMVAAGELPAARISGKWLFDKELIDAWVSQHTRLPDVGMMQALVDRLFVLQGSDDWLLDQALGSLREQLDQAVVSARVGSFAGLEAIGRGRAHFAGIHVADADLPRAMRSGPPTYLVGLFGRQQVLVVGAKHKGAVQGVEDVVARGLRFAIRQPGSGTHRLTETLLKQAGHSLDELEAKGPYTSHLEVALAVAHGVADAGLVIQVAAELTRQVYVPLLEETYRLAIPAALFTQDTVARFLDRMLDWLDKRQPDQAPGYSFAPLGKLIAPPSTV
jgi:putative molybdopterin biosynthesis protein